MPKTALRRVAAIKHSSRFNRDPFVHKVPIQPSSQDGVAMLTVADVEEAQQAWGQGIVEIAAAHEAGEDYVQRARSHVESLYSYDIGPVLFKPTFAAREQFRPTFEGALSYFVGGNSAFSEDKGFAIKNWKNVRFENEEIIIDGKIALAMGNYFFTSPDDEELKVEFSFGYIVDSTGSLRINLHHSSMPASL